MAGTLGVLVAGGRGRRLGLGVPKALAPWAGTTLLARALATLRALCEDVVVCAPPSLALPTGGATRVDDPPGAAGPLAGVVAGLASRPFTRAAVLGVDLPLVDAPLLAALGARLGDHAAVLPAPGGRTQPLAAWYAPAAVAPLAGALARGDRALVPAVESLPALRLDDAGLAALGIPPERFLNVNEAADLERAARLAAGARA